MSSVALTLISLLALAGVGFVRYWLARKEGQKDEKLERAEGTLNEIKKAKNAITRAKSDERLADRLRKRYDLE